MREMMGENFKIFAQVLGQKFAAYHPTEVLQGMQSALACQSQNILQLAQCIEKEVQETASEAGRKSHSLSNLNFDKICGWFTYWFPGLHRTSCFRNSAPENLSSTRVCSFQNQHLVVTPSTRPTDTISTSSTIPTSPRGSTNASAPCV